VSKKKKERKVYTYYEIKNEKIFRKLKKCPRCGSFMAKHNTNVPRRACGNCSYTEYITTFED
jgi:small subunit ribosomal protein S27Ae